MRPLAGRALRRIYASPGRRCSTLVQNNEHGHPNIVFKVGKPNLSLPDAFALAAPQLKPLDASMTELLHFSPNSTVPKLLRFTQPNGIDAAPPDNEVLQAAAQHFFNLHGKRFRPTISLLAASAANGGSKADARQGRLPQIVEMVRERQPSPLPLLSRSFLLT